MDSQDYRMRTRLGNPAGQHSSSDESRSAGTKSISCSGCRLAPICLPIALQAPDITRVNSIIQRGLPIQRGESVYRERQPFRSVYAVRSGAFKSYSIADDSSEQVTGFYFPGELFGMDGVSANEHVSTTVALETSTLCEIPFDRLRHLSATIPSLQLHFFKLMSQEIARDQQMILMLSKHSAAQRVTALLLSISLRNARRNLSATSFRLCMSRKDIGNYLGLTIETVSRIFSHFQKSGALATKNREITRLNQHLLQAVLSPATKAA